MGQQRKSACRGPDDAANDRGPPSGYQAMWLFVMFDLPVKTRLERRRYAQFRKHLIEEGFMALQYSVYARYYESEEASKACRRRVAAKVPEPAELPAMNVIVAVPDALVLKSFVVW